MLYRSASRFISAVSLAVLVAAGVGPAAANDTGVTDDTIKIGVLTSLTGPGAYFGSGAEASAILAFEQRNAAGGIHGRKIEWVSVDDETSPPKAIVAFKRLVNQEQVFTVFGPAASGVAQAMVPTFHEHSEVPVFIGVASTPAVTDPVIPNVFRAGSMSDIMTSQIMANYALDELKAESIVLIRQTDEFGKRGAEGFLGRLEERGVKASEEVFGVSDTDFTAQIARIAAASPDLIVIYGYPNASALIMRQIRQFGLEAQVLTSTGANSRSFPGIVGESAIGALIMSTFDDLPESGTNPPMVEFRESFMERFPEFARQNRPDLGETLAYGAILGMLEGLERAGPELTREGFIKALETLDNFETGITRPISFTAERHDGQDSARVIVIEEDLTRRQLPGAIDAASAD